MSVCVCVCVCITIGGVGELPFNFVCQRIMMRASNLRAKKECVQKKKRSRKDAERRGAWTLRTLACSDVR